MDGQRDGEGLGGRLGRCHHICHGGCDRFGRQRRHHGRRFDADVRRQRLRRCDSDGHRLSQNRNLRHHFGGSDQFGRRQEFGHDRHFRPGDRFGRHDDRFGRDGRDGRFDHLGGGHGRRWQSLCHHFCHSFGLGLVFGESDGRHRYGNVFGRRQLFGQRLRQRRADHRRFQREDRRRGAAALRRRLPTVSLSDAVDQTEKRRKDVLRFDTIDHQDTGQHQHEKELHFSFRFSM